MTRPTLLLVLLTLLAAACGTPAPAAETPTPPAATRTPPPTASPSPAPPTATATPIPVEGTLETRVNVRSGPGAGFESLGLLEAGERVQVVARDEDGDWYQILYPSAPQGRGWVAAQFVRLAAGAEIPLDATPTPAGPTGRVIQRLNVRAGPGTTFDALGMLEPGTVVSLLGKNATASWFQIDHPDGPGGRGWVTAQYIQTEIASELPVLDDFGKAVTPGAPATPSGPLPTPTATVGPALDDGDSATNPAVRVTFSASGTRQFVYSSQVSAPEGDLEDWVEFTPYASGGTSARLSLSLSCSGKGILRGEIRQGGASFPGMEALRCGDEDRLVYLPAGLPYQIRLAVEAGGGLRLVQYVLTVRNDP